MSITAAWLNRNGFDVDNDWDENKIARRLVGKVLGPSLEDGEDYFDVEFNEGVPGKEFMLTCGDARTSNVQFDVVAGDEVAVLVFNDMRDIDNNSIIARKLTFEQVGIVLEQEAEKRRERERREEEAAKEARARQKQAQSYVSELDAAGGITKGVRYGENESGFYMVINGVGVPREIVLEVRDLLAPRFLEAAEKQQAAHRIKYLKDNYTPEQLEIAVAAYHSK